jgi:hypothetical protein
MDKKTRIWVKARDLFFKHNKLENTDMERFSIWNAALPSVQQRYIDLASEQLHQEEAKAEAERDEHNKEIKKEIIRGAMARLPANAIAGKSEISYMTDVMLKCDDIPFMVLSKIFTVDVLMTFYYGEITVELASDIIHKAFLNLKDKTAMIAAIAKKT